MSRLRGLLRRAGGERGFTLVELLVSMAILGTVVGGISALFASGMRGQADLNRRWQAQNQLNVAMDKLKREVHAACHIHGNQTTPTGAVSLVEVDTSPCDGTVGITWCVSGTTLYRIGSLAATCTGGVAYVSNVATATPFSYSPYNYPASSYTLARLHVDIQVSPVAGSAKDSFHLTDDFAFRNSQRQ